MRPRAGAKVGTLCGTWDERERSLVPATLYILAPEAEERDLPAAALAEPSNDARFAPEFGPA